MHFSHRSGRFELSSKTHIMGIINITPDSFFEGSRITSDLALKAAEELINEGADLIDVGGESTRPGYSPVSAEEEAERIIPFIEKYKGYFGTPLSIDTMKSYVARLALESGADIINDVFGGLYDASVFSVVAEYQCGYILGHNRPGGHIAVNEIIDEIKNWADSAVSSLEGCGFSREFICIDPGIGFSKSFTENLSVIRNFEDLKSLGLPLMAGVSRKSVIGNILSLPPHDRLEGSLAAAVYLSCNGADFIRTHDVKETVRALKVADKITRE